ncbi:hypothetical protein [Haloprofundus salinisoli]|uniref:hypothetical protein n=1 Tax=Haloprofundus salinisoli TaxID=2876193 RepID=UPI001CCF9B6C|nr:hypothetical protein [Haloprofundus salinisoli]
MATDVQVFGVLLLSFGLPSAVWPSRVAKFEERLDSIGSKRSWSEIEPADWKVSLTRVAGIVMVLVGIVWVVSP